MISWNQSCLLSFSYCHPVDLETSAGDRVVRVELHDHPAVGHHHHDHHHHGHHHHVHHSYVYNHLSYTIITITNIMNNSLVSLACNFLWLLRPTRLVKDGHTVAINDLEWNIFIEITHFVSLTKGHFSSYLQIIKYTTICPRWLFLKAERCKGDLDLLAGRDADVVGLVLNISSVNNHKCCNQNAIQDLKLDLVSGIVIGVVVRLYGSSFNRAVRCSALAFDATRMFVRSRT